MMKLAGAALVALLAVGPADAAAPGARFKDWSLDCVKGQPSGGGSKVCLIQHEVRPATGGRSLMIARVRFLGKQPMLVFLLPPNLSPKTEVSYTIDTGVTATTAVRECNAQVCWAVVPIGEYLLASLKAGRQLVVRTPALPGEQGVSLGGFTAAYGELARMQR
jgi:invasion protein IalB